MSPRLEMVRASREALREGDAGFFAARLPPREHYRIAATFPEDTVFLDIETTGLSLYYDNITLVGLSRGNRYACFISGTQDTTWLTLLNGAKCVVTFNGTMFDLKFPSKYFPNLCLPKTHVDLRFLGNRASLSGSQKKIESELGINREGDLIDVRGVDAALMWYEYKAGDTAAGQKLVRYNHADVEGMKGIFDYSVNHIINSEDLKLGNTNGTCFSALKSSIEFAKTSRLRADGKIFVPPFRGRKGPVVNYADLAKHIPEKSLRVVGIDLTGSERRPTGWCVLDGRRADTRLLKTDNELIAATRDASPDIVSIDSPLSLPRGRRSVSDSDPRRRRYGITRDCERILKQRGVNVYPCLIPSMQALTKRGIELARKLRSIGIPVLESYPGAAQDIMNIPREPSELKMTSVCDSVSVEFC